MTSGYQWASKYTQEIHITGSELEPSSFRDTEVARKALNVTLKGLLDHSANHLLQRTEVPALQ